MREWMPVCSRRAFLAGLAALPIASGAAAPLKIGYAAITWGADNDGAIEDISSLGFAGIQFRAEVVENFRPAQLCERLSRKALTFIALSSGQLALDADPAEQIEQHVAHARYVKEAGGLYLQIFDKLTSYPRRAVPEDCRRIGKLLTEVGKRTADLGIPLGYHNHLNTLSQTPEGFEMIMAASDPRYVKIVFDTAHALAGGGDPAKMIESYQDRLLFLHLKDVLDLPNDPAAKYPFQWVELGRGRVDIPAVFTAIDRIGFKDWVVIELDRVPDKSRTPKDSAAINKAYLEKLGRY